MAGERSLTGRLVLIILGFGALLAASGFLGISMGPSGSSFGDVWAVFFGRGGSQSVTATIVRQIRLPRVVLAAMVGGSLALGGLVFQALLRNPLAEPYILGISGGSAVGAIIGLLLGFSPFPGVALAAFAGSMLILFVVLTLVSGQSAINRDSMLLGGVMMNALCGAVIMFLISMSQTAQVHQILFWLMGDFTMSGNDRLLVFLTLLPCFLLIFVLARPMNLLLAGHDSAAALGINVQRLSLILLVTTSFMVSIVVCQSGLVGFVGLVVPHVLRMFLGPDHRLLVPASILGGGAYLILCDLLARTLPGTGEMPVGIVTAVIGAPLFLVLLWRAKRCR